MPSQKLNLDQPVEPTDAAEARMRLALGLTTTRPAAPAGQGQSFSGPAPVAHDSTRQRRRFAQDGDVPVVILNRSRDGEAGGENKLATLTNDLREERQARGRVERALEEANLTIQSLKTKLAHTEMTWEEKLRDEREARAQVDVLLFNEQEARKQAETKAAEAALALSVLERKFATAEVVAQPAPKADLFEDDAVAAPVKKRRSLAQVENPVAEAPAKRTPRKSKMADPVPAQDAEPQEEDQPIEWWLPSFRAARKAPAPRKRAAR